MRKQEIISILMLSPFYSSLSFSDKRLIVKAVEDQSRDHRSLDDAQFTRSGPEESELKDIFPRRKKRRDDDII